MKRVKLITTLLVAALAVSMFSGCGSKSTNGAKDQNKGGSVDASEEKSSTVSMLYADNAGYPYKEDWLVLDLIKENTGVELDIQAVPEADFETKKQMVLNSGDIPDIICKTFAKPEDAISGLLLPISDYEDKMPNYKKFIEENNIREQLDNSRLSNGKYYTLPVKVHTSKVQDQQWLVRTDIFEKNNIEIPTNMDELYEAGVKLKELYPDSTPITNRFKSANIMSAMAGGFDTIAGWTIGDGMYYEKDTDSWVFAPTSDNWKEMLQYANKLLEAGVLDEEFATLDSTVYEQRIVQGQTFIMCDWTGNAERYNQQGKENDPDYNVSPIYPIEGTKGNHMLAWKGQWGQGWAFPNTLKDKDNFEDVLEFIDWCYSDEAEIALTFGVEGETYVEEDGVLKYKDPNVDYSATAGLDNNSLCVREHIDFLYGKLSKEEVELFDKIKEDGCVRDPNPQSPLSIEKLEETKVYTSTLIDYVNTMMESFIFGKESFDNWDNFIKNCEEKGSAKLQKEYNDAWKNRK